MREPIFMCGLSPQQADLFRKSMIEIDHLQSKIGAVEADNEALRKQEELSVKKFNRISGELMARQDEVRILKEQIERMQNQDCLDGIKSCKDAEYINRLLEAERKSKNLEAENNSVIGRNAQLSEIIATQNNQIRELCKENAELKKHDNNPLAVVIKNLKDRIKELEETISMLSGDRKRLEAENEELKRNVGYVMKQLEAFNFIRSVSNQLDEVKNV